jgi:cell wall-associated NlpC family hydrolase
MTAHPRISAKRRAVNSFRLEGPSIALDPRIHAFRPDIADLALAGQVFATHYAQPVAWRCTASRVMVRQAPSADAPAISQLLLGEEFAVIDMSGGWAWGYCSHDHYVGYVAAEALSREIAAATHVISTPLALVFAEADIKSDAVVRLPMGARVTALEVNETGFIHTGKGWLHPRHAMPVGDIKADPVAIAEQLIGAPYLWGGRAGDGLDCSGLVQLSLAFCGIFAPRDSDQQQAALGREIPRPPSGEAELRRGDLIFFPGHVGFMADAERLIHASAWWMRVQVEPLADVVARR